MARAVYLTPEQFANAERLARATFGDNTMRALLRDQRLQIAADLRTGTASYVPPGPREPIIPRMARSVTAIINTTRIENFVEDKADAVLRRMNFGGQVIYSSNLDLQISLRNELETLMMHLKAASGHPFLFRYRTTFKYWIGGKVMDSLPPDGTFAIGGVVNVHSYSTKVEYKRWQKPFRIVWRSWANRVANRRRMDTRIRNLQGITETNKGRPWPSPVIELGYLNTMRGKTGDHLGPQRYKTHLRIFRIG